MNKNIVNYALISSISLLSYSAATNAQESDNQDKPKEEAQVEQSQSVDEKIIIKGNYIGDLGLESETYSSSRLDMSAFETPATVEIIDESVMRARGYEKLSDAVRGLPGVVTGEQPTAPSTFSIRGFSRGQITVLRDGLWIGPSAMVMRPQNTYNLERVEILRGPASVINGIGAVAGTINAVTKSAKPSSIDSTDLMASFGRYGARHYGLSSQGELTESSWYNVNVSDYSLDGYVPNTNSESTNITASAFWQLSDDVAFTISFDHLDDDVGSYYGTPLVPIEFARQPLTDVVVTERGETIDEAMRFNNYNVSDAVAESEQLFWKTGLTWDISLDAQLETTLYGFEADRYWKNAEGYVFCTEVVGTCTELNEIQRYYGYFWLDHEQEMIGNRTTLKFDHDLFGRSSQTVFGFEIADLDFERTRGFRRSHPQEPADSLDPYNPEQGVYGPLELRGVSPTTIDTQALFAENLLELTPNWKLVSALRYDRLDLDRMNFDASGADEGNGFNRDYSWSSWRLGTTYNLTEDTLLYAQYSNAKDPINSNIFLVNANQNFDLTDAKQWEVGLKKIWSQSKTQLTLSYYDIERDDIFERFALDSATNVGGRSSNGVELSLTSSPTDNITFSFNTAYTNAEFKESANFQALAGNTPPNVPEWTTNVRFAYDNIANVPLQAGFEWSMIDDRFGDNENQIYLSDYELTNLFTSYTWDNYRVSARVDNVFDEIYVPWSDIYYVNKTDPGFIYANQLLLNTPRTYRLTFEANF